MPVLLVILRNAGFTDNYQKCRFTGNSQKCRFYGQLSEMPVLHVVLNNTIVLVVVKTSTRVGSGGLRRLFGPINYLLK